jgi:hypothetical protein
MSQSGNKYVQNWKMVPGKIQPDFLSPFAASAPKWSATCPTELKLLKRFGERGRNRAFNCISWLIDE